MNTFPASFTTTYLVYLTYMVILFAFSLPSESYPSDREKYSSRLSTSSLSSCSDPYNPFVFPPINKKQQTRQNIIKGIVALTTLKEENVDEKLDEVDGLETSVPY